MDSVQLERLMADALRGRVDDRVLLVGSANLTATGVDHSMEVALLVTGGPAPRRAADYLRGLIASRQLVRLG